MIDFIVALIALIIFGAYIGTRPVWKKGKGIVAKNAKVGAGTVVWNYVILWKCEIGTNCVIGSHAEISGKIGNNCKVECGAFIPYGVVIEDFVFIGPHVCFTNDRFPRAYGNWEMKPTLVKERASIGANASIRCGVIIGKHAMIGMGAIITKDVPDYAIVINTNEIIGDVRNRKV